MVEEAVKVTRGREAPVAFRTAAFLAQIIGYVTGRVSKADERWAEGADTDEDDG